MSLPYIFLCFPRDKRLTVYQQIEANEHARYMYQFMEQRREQFKMQQHGAQMPMLHAQQRPNQFNRRRRQRKSRQPKNANYQPIRQAPVIAAKPIISQCQPKYQQPSRHVPIQAKPSFVKPQPESLIYQPSRQAPFEVRLTFVEHQPMRQVPVKATKPNISQFQPNHHQKNVNCQSSRKAPAKSAKPFISQCQSKYQQPIRQAPAKSAKPFISQFQAKRQPKKANYQPIRKAPVKPMCQHQLSGPIISPTGVKLVPNPFYTAPPTTCKPIVSPTGVKLVPNPFYKCPV
uniref:Uncharacterized protein n=1 Tax=Caenorhabditis japonica TaxID=281687 RepID=A0A8R1I985_CAEJA